MKNHPFIVLILIVIPSIIFSQNDSTKSSRSFFQQREFGKYFISDHYGHNTRINVGLGMNLSEYNIDQTRTAKNIVYNETVIGAELPIFKKSWGTHSLAFSIPLSFSVWFDFTEDLTAPILNTDYRFALLELNYMHRLKGKSIKNIGVKFIPFFHESTHIGDELTIARMLSEVPIIRVNVSYESAELALIINDAESKIERNNSFKIGAKFLLYPNKGWYTISEFEGDTTLVESSKKWVEPYFQYQFQNPNGFLSFKRAMFVASFNFHLRVKYGYPFYHDSEGSIKEINLKEKYEGTFNLLFGWRFLKSKGDLSNLGIYARAYTGINYHGQFRNIPRYRFVGLSIIYEI